MSNAQRDALLARIERAVVVMVRSIEEGDVPRLEEMADAAAFSPFHFHRVYRLLTGETPAETTRRLRAAQALDHIRSGGGSVTSAAMEAGYGSSQSLAKSLRALVAASATELRSDPERLDAAFAKLSEPLSPSGHDAPTLTVELARTGPFEVVTQRHVGDEGALNGVYNELFGIAGGAEAVGAILGFPHADQAHEDRSSQVFDAALRLTRPAKGEARHALIDGGTHLVARHEGSFDGLPDVIDALTALVLSSIGVGLADRPVMIHYLDDPEETDEGDLRSDVYLPIVLA